VGFLTRLHPARHSTERACAQRARSGRVRAGSGPDPRTAPSKPAETSSSACVGDHATLRSMHSAPTLVRERTHAFTQLYTGNTPSWTQAQTQACARIHRNTDITTHICTLIRRRTARAVAHAHAHHTRTNARARTHRRARVRLHAYTHPHTRKVCTASNTTPLTEVLAQSCMRRRSWLCSTASDTLVLCTSLAVPCIHLYFLVPPCTPLYSPVLQCGAVQCAGGCVLSCRP
jgi:hypothetical protein